MDNIRKRLVAITALALVALMLALPFACMDTEAAVNEGVLMTVPNASASPGDSVEVSFELHGSLTGFTIEIAYDSNALTFQSYNNPTSLTFYINTDTAGKISVVWFGTQDNSFSGQFLTVTFKVGSAVSGDQDITMSCDDAVWDNGATEGSLTQAVGTLYISEGGTPGDTTPNETTPTGTILTVSSASGNVGDEVMINVSIEGNTGIAGSVLIVSYDSDVLEALSAKAGSVTSNGYFFANTEKPGKVTMSWLLLEGIYKDGSMMEITFKIKDTAVKSTTISVKDNGTADPDKSLISTTTVSGKITIGSTSIPMMPDLMTILVIIAVIALVAIALIWLRRRSKKLKEGSNGKTKE